MKRRTLLLCIVALTSILIASSFIVLSQGYFTVKLKPEYLNYDFKALFGRGTRTLIDTSGAPNVIIYEGTDDNIIDMNITIGDKVYYYPKDFTFQDKFYLEFSAITGEGLFRDEATITFNLPGKPIIRDFVVSRISNWPSTPTGSLENTRFEGTLKLAGTKQFALVDGFGVEAGSYLPSGLFTRHFGYIIGWPLASTK